jgi:hypothetical protein
MGGPFCQKGGQNRLRSIKTGVVRAIQKVPLVPRDFTFDIFYLISLDETNASIHIFRGTS